MAGNSLVVIGEDFNQLPDMDLCALGLTSAVNTPTHRGHLLDRLYTTSPLYTNVKTVRSTMKTDHLAVIARGDQENIVDNNKTATSFHIRKQTPAKNALFMSTLASIDWSNVLQQTDVQLASDFCKTCCQC